MGDTSEPEASPVSLRSAFNPAAPVNQLPTELVAKILRSGAWGCLWDFVILSHICQHWRNIVLGTPRLWAEAASFALSGDSEYEHGRICDKYKCLPTLLARSAPFPLKANFLRLGALILDNDRGCSLSAVLEPHFSRITRVSAGCLSVGQFKRFMDLVRHQIRNLESVHILQVQWNLASNLPLKVSHSRFWSDTDLPHLHTLAIPAYCFIKSIAVPSLKDLALHGKPGSYDQFLVALGRCADNLEVLRLRSWSHPCCTPSGAQNSAIRTVHLPNLRHFGVSLSGEAKNTDPLTFLFTSLSFPSDASIQIDWRYKPGNIRELLSNGLVGLQAAPFFDSMYLHLYALPYIATLHCYVSDVERLVVGERPLVSAGLQRRRGDRDLSRFLDQHRYATTTQLAIDIDMKAQNEYLLLPYPALLQKFVSGLPKLRRLDLLGRPKGSAKLDVVKSFLGLMVGPGGEGKTLGYTCEALEPPRGTSELREYVVQVRKELDRLEAVLKTYQKASGPRRLQRLELCITYASRDSHPSRRAYPYVHKVTPPNEQFTAWLASTYLARFRRLVDEVVVVGHVERRGPGYRILPNGEDRVPSGTSIDGFHPRKEGY